MKKIFAVILASVSLAFCLTGCVREELGIRLEKDGTGSIQATVALKKTSLNSLPHSAAAIRSRARKPLRSSMTANRMSLFPKQRNMRPLRKWKRRFRK